MVIHSTRRDIPSAKQPSARSAALREAAYREAAIRRRRPAAQSAACGRAVCWDVEPIALFHRTAGKDADALTDPRARRRRRRGLITSAHDRQQNDEILTHRRCVLVERGPPG